MEHDLSPRNNLDEFENGPTTDFVYCEGLPICSKGASYSTILQSSPVINIYWQVELALHEAQASFKSYQIDLQNKPEWYAPQVNSASKVPAVAYGGPEVPPEKPSTDSQKIAESLVLLEFVADLYPNSTLLSNDPVLRAKTRFFIDTVANKFVPGFFGPLARGESLDGTLKAIEEIQALLPAEGFAVGPDYTIADASITPFAARVNLTLKNDIGFYKQGEGKQAYDTLQTDPKYERFRKYYRDVTERPSFKTTFDEEYIKASLMKHFDRAAKAAN